MKYYAFIDNNKITGKGNFPTVGMVNCIEITEEVFNNIEQYIYLDGEIVLNPNWDNIQLENAKDIKIATNDIERDEALVRGVTYREVLFDSDTDQKVNLLATVTTMSDEESIVWFGMDNQPLLCNKQDLINIGGLITQLHSFCWNRNAEIKAQIHYATTIEEVEAIEINYDEVI